MSVGYDDRTWDDVAQAPIVGHYEDWQVKAHWEAWNNPKPGMEAAFVNLVKAWGQYAEQYRRTFDQQIGDGYIPGNEWADMGKAIRSGLTTCECGPRLIMAWVDGLMLKWAEINNASVEY